MQNTDIQPYNNEFKNKEFLKEEAYLRAKEKVKKIVGFYWHLAVFIVVNAFIIFTIVVNGGSLWHFGTWATPLFWGIGLLFHFLGVFGVTFLFGKDWEERKIREFMEKDKNNWE
ncbi:2TM domain-containing protein [Neotamlana laminarinivorans]|uniref:2TM domain-containing protein n=1 Tax=Neotamlana laminarinivorans TaxID=2883124 RepID=A0A9X1I2N3_9FLAO|nr:2TM domain-containing protein [Tamlana laminarinivorans]MCB4799533.1 2TM domain-containing protein [Tamlana laminarinivorans]